MEGMNGLLICEFRDIRCFDCLCQDGRPGRNERADAMHHKSLNPAGIRPISTPQGSPKAFNSGREPVDAH